MILKSMMRHIRIWFAYASQFLKTRMIYQIDFWTGLTANISLQFVNLLFITVIFQKVPTLRGWSHFEVLFIYGHAIMAYSLFHAFFSGIYMLGNTYIVEGNLDRVLVRPLNPLFQIYFERVDIEDIGEMLIGLAVVIYAAAHAGLSWTPARLFMLPVFVSCGVMIFLGVFTALSSVSFWFVDRIGLLPPIYNMIAFGRYPVTIYNTALRFLLSWIIPFAFVGFFPSTWFLGRHEFAGYYIATPVIAITFFMIGYAVFNRGLRRYESAGS
jgi:ABC-2 type transport system permease protein